MSASSSNPQRPAHSQPSDGLARPEPGAASVHYRVALHDSLIDMATGLVAEVAGADGVGVTLTQDGITVVTAASAPFVVEVDALQYSLVEGPCVSAVAERSPFSSGTLGVGEPRWSRFGAGAAALGVHSVASFPLIVDDDVIGSINVYAHARDAFNAETIRHGVALAGPAAIAVSRAALVTAARLFHLHLSEGVSDQATIQEAVGVLMFRGAISAEEAHDHLREIATVQHVELDVVAAILIADAAIWAHTAGRVTALEDGEQPGQALSPSADDGD